MTGELIAKTTLIAVALALILVGIWHEDKLIAFENRVWEFIKDRAAYVVARIILKVRIVKIRAVANE